MGPEEKRRAVQQRIDEISRLKRSAEKSTAESPEPTVPLEIPEGGAEGHGRRAGWIPGCGCQKKVLGSHFGVPPILEPILVGIGMFTGGTGF